MSDQYWRYLADLDPELLERLMADYGQEVWNYAFFITKNRSMADDIAQDVFVQAYRNSSGFRGEASMRTWLFKITRNISINYVRSAFFRKVFLVDRVKAKSNAASAENDFMEQETANEVWRRVLQLPAKHREVIILHAKYELSTQQMAQVLQIPEGTVKSRLHAARRRLSALLQKEELLHETF
jgi:RNA polymerase sigma-70 factor, ECF subfamily